MEWSWVAFGLGVVVGIALLQILADWAQEIDAKKKGEQALVIKQSGGGIEIAKFKSGFPAVEGYTLGNLRVDGGKVVGFVLLDKEGIERYILYLGADCKIGPYW